MNFKIETVANGWVIFPGSIGETNIDEFANVHVATTAAELARIVEKFTIRKPTEPVHQRMVKIGDMDVMLTRSADQK